MRRACATWRAKTRLGQFHCATTTAFPSPSNLNGSSAASLSDVDKARTGLNTNESRSAGAAPETMRSDGLYKGCSVNGHSITTGVSLAMYTPMYAVRGTRPVSARSTCHISSGNVTTARTFTTH